MFKLLSPCIDSYVQTIGKNYRFPCIVPPSLLNQVNNLFRVCADLKPVRTTTGEIKKCLWLRIPRGTYEDYKAEQFLPLSPRKRWTSGMNYGGRRNNVTVSEWTTAYPDEYSWYCLYLLEMDDILQVYLNGNKLLNVLNIERETFDDNDIPAYQLCGLLAIAAAESINLIRSGTYNDLLASQLPYKCKTGIVRADYVDGSENQYICVVPYYVSSLDGYYMIEYSRYGVIEDFMHVDDADMEAFGDKIEWNPIMKGELITGQNTIE